MTKNPHISAPIRRKMAFAIISACLLLGSSLGQSCRGRTFRLEGQGDQSPAPKVETPAAASNQKNGKSKAAAENKTDSEAEPKSNQPSEPVHSEQSAPMHAAIEFYKGSPVGDSNDANTKPPELPSNPNSSATANPSRSAAPSALDIAPSTPEWHRLQMRVSGSMCLSCLKELEDNLRKLPGVDGVRVQKAQINYFQPYTPDMSNWADTIVVFNNNLLSREALRDAVHRNGYHGYKFVDKVLERAPDSKDLKF